MNTVPLLSSTTTRGSTGVELVVHTSSYIVSLSFTYANHPSVLLSPITRNVFLISLPFSSVMAAVTVTSPAAFRYRVASSLCVPLAFTLTLELSEEVHVTFPANAVVNSGTVFKLTVSLFPVWMHRLFPNTCCFPSA